jgi:hypothetical protein
MFEPATTQEKEAARRWVEDMAPIWKLECEQYKQRRAKELSSMWQPPLAPVQQPA